MLLSSKLLSLLKQFSKHELNSFKKFVNSPFHNEQEELSQLFAILDIHVRQTEKEQQKRPLEKKKVWEYIFGEKPYQDVRMRRLSSDLIKLIYSFLSYHTYQKDNYSKELSLLKALRKRSLKKHFDSSLNQIKNALEKEELRNADYHFSNYTINYNIFNFAKDARSKIKIFDHLEKADYHLECYYLTKKLENYCDYLGLRGSISIDTEIALVPDFLDYVEKSIYIREPSLRAYFWVTKMLLETTNDNYFLSLKAHLESYATQLSIQELDIFYIHLKNYCIVKINKGKTEYLVQLFEIFQTLLKEEIILKDGIISPQNYKNITTVGLQIKKYEWVEKFIKTYTDYLPKANRENALTYNLSKVYFSQKKYNQVIEQLREVEYKNHTYALGGKLILLKTYYELDEFQALDSLTDSFRIYIRRNKIISREVKQQYLNMLRFVKKLSGTRRRDKKALDKIRAQIDKCKALAGKKWILEKVAELS